MRFQADPTACGLGRLGTDCAWAALSVVIMCWGFLACSFGDPLATVRQLQEQGRFEESIPALMKIIDAGNRDPETLFRYGQALSLTGRASSATWSLQAAMDSEDWLVPAALQLGQNGLTTGNHDLSIRAIDRLLERSPDHAGGLMIRGSAYLQTRRNYAEALADFEKLVELSPERLDIYAPLASALLGLDRPQEALEVIEEARRRSREDDVGLGPSPTEAFWCTAQASFASDSGNPVEASRILDECLEADPTSQTLIADAIEFYDRRAQGRRSLEILRTAYDLAPENRSFRTALVRRLHGLDQTGEAESILRAATNQEDVDAANFARADLARFLLQIGRTEEGVDALENLIEIQSNPSPDILFSYAEGLIGLGRYSDALEVAETTPVEVHRSMLRGRIEFERGDYEAARRELDQAMRLWPNSAPIRYYSALTAERLGDFDRAIEEYRHAIRSDANLFPARLRLAHLHMAEGSDSQALAILKYSSATNELVPNLDGGLLEIELLARLGKQSSVGVLPRSPDRSPAETRSQALVARARGVAHRGGPEAALKVLESSAALDPSDFTMTEAYALRIDALVELDRIAEATELARSLVDAHPDHAAYWSILGRVSMEQNASEARSRFERALELDAANVSALIGLAQVSAAEGSLEAAASFYSRAVARDASARDAVFGLVDVLVELGRQDEARAALESYLMFGDPYDGKAALRLARIVESSNDARSLELARRAQRFGAGDAAAKMIEKLRRASATTS